MSSRNGDKTRDDRSAEERALARLYKDASRETPPAALDAKILSASRDALNAADAPETSESVHARPNPPPEPEREGVGRGNTRATFAKRWATPISIAAVVVLAVGIVLRLARESALEPVATAPTAAQAPAAPADETLAREHAYGEPRAKTNVAAAPRPAETKQPERGVRDDADSFADKPSRIEERAPAASAPAVTGKLGAPADAPSRARSVAPSVDATERRNTESSPAPAAMEFKAGAESGDVQRKREQPRPGVTTASAELSAGAGANVISVTVSGKPGEYQFTVGIRSPDRDCAQHADWWEVLSENGALLYRHVLAHSHVDEQPFARTGGPVPIAPTTVVWVRAHMNRAGYGGAAFKGSVANGFAAATAPRNFAAALARQPPQPAGCAF